MHEKQSREKVLTHLSLENKKYEIDYFVLCSCNR